MQASYQKGDVVYKSGDVAHCMYFIVSGRVVIQPSSRPDLERVRGQRTSVLRSTEDSDPYEDKETCIVEDIDIVENLGMWSAGDGEIFGQ